MGSSTPLSRKFAGRYVIEREIGRGGTSTVYLAQDEQTGQRVAVKVLRDILQGSAADDRFLREIRVTGTLRHPRILSVLDAGTDGAQLYFVLPYMAGGSLRDRLRREPQLPLDDAIDIARDIADALAQAHAQGFIHRDVKPENILFLDGRAHLADFGIARAFEHATGESTTSAGVVRGTPAYMSPEQVAGSSTLDGRSDLYSLGCVLYEMLAGVPAFVGPTPETIASQRLAYPPRTLRAFRPSIPPGIDAVVTRSLALVAADRFRNGTEMAAALERARTVDTVAGSQPGPPRNRARALATVAGLGALVALVAAVWALTRPAGDLDDTLVAIAPFDVYDSRLSLWREGYTDMLASGLDGAGRLRTVSPAVTVRRWRPPGVPSAARELAAATRARYVVYGRVVPSGADSIRATAAVYDARARRDLASVDVRDAFDRPDRLGDALVLRLVAELGESGESPASRGRVRSLGAASLPALKAYLRGEYFLRRSVFDSAAMAYGEALGHDPVFALAHWRMKIAAEWRDWGPPTVGDEHALRAGQLNRGLAPRESLLIVVDSLWASASATDDRQWSRIRRIDTLLTTAARRYPEDPWIWFKVGEARFHLALGLDYSLEQHLDAFDRAIALDSGFALPYVNHVVDLALILHGPERALRYIRGFTLIALPGVEDSAAALTAQLLDARVAETAGTRRALDGASADVLYRVAANLDMWFDPNETALDVGRRLLAASRGSARFLDVPTKQLRMARMLSVRGRLDAAWQHLRAGVPLGVPDDETIEVFTDMALLDAVPPPTVDSVMTLWLRSSARGSVFALAWFARQRDTLMIARTARALAARTSNAEERRLARYGARAADAYRQLIRGDSSRALRELAQLPDSLCFDCYREWLQRGALMLAARDVAGAAREFQRVRTYAWNVPSYPLAMMGLARAAELRGDTASASRARAVVAAAFLHADSSIRRLALAREPASRRTTR